MRFLDDLRAEHDVIERVALAFHGFAAAHDAGAADVADRAGFLRFFRAFAGRFHHAREEDVLFPALVRETEVPSAHGPIFALTQDHLAMAALLDAIDAAPERGFAEPVRRYVMALLHHIDAENSVLLPESALRFRRASVLELDDPPMDAEARAARDEGVALAERHDAVPVPGLHRGDGCPACPAYGVTCEGVERTWWSELEWEDALERMGNG